MYEVRRIVVNVLREEGDPLPETWNWTRLTDSIWCVPASDSELLKSFAGFEDFEEWLDSGAEVP